MLDPHTGRPDHRISHPVIFSLSGYMKDGVYRTPMADIKGLKERIEAAITAVSVDVLQHTRLGLECRSDFYG